MTASYTRYTSTSLSVFTKLQWNNNCNVFNVWHLMCVSSGMYCLMYRYFFVLLEYS